jgi:hypothetical protein
VFSLFALAALLGIFATLTLVALKETESVLGALLLIAVAIVLLAGTASAVFEAILTGIDEYAR